MSLRRLHAAEWVVTAGAVALGVAMFLPWYEAPCPDRRCAEVSAWQVFGVIDFFLALAVLVGAVLVLSTIAESRPGIPIGVAPFSALVAMIALALVAYRLIELPDVVGALLEDGNNQGGSASWGPLDSPSVTRKVGAWLGLAGALLLTAGAWWSMRDERQRGSP